VSFDLGGELRGSHRQRECDVRVRRRRTHAALDQGGEKGFTAGASIAVATAARYVWARPTT
jgi:hypothetical protein